MAILLHRDGTEEMVTPANPARGFTLDECYRLLGCRMVQHVAVPPFGILIDEEAKLLDEWDRYINEPATERYLRWLIPGDVLVGNVLILESRSEFQ